MIADTPPQRPPSFASSSRSQSGAWVYLPLRTAAILSVAVFLARIALDLFVTHSLYQPQHGLMALLDISLSAWAFAEVVLIDRATTPVPLRSLRLAAGVQLVLGLLRGLAVVAMLGSQAANDVINPRVDLAVAALFICLDAGMFIVMSKLFIDAFSHTERVRADQLERQVALTDAAAADLAAAHEAREAGEARQRRTLRRKLKSSLLASAVAHEIHIPLSTILLRTRMALATGESPREVLAGVAADAQRVVRTIEKMKVLLRVVQSDHVRVDLAEVIQSALVQLKWQLVQGEIVVEPRALDRPCIIQGDDVQLQLAVSNLLRNAIESITATGCGAGRIAVELRRRTDSATVVIGDDGLGWSGAEREKTPLSTSKPEGSGIGLTIVRTVVRNHRGKVAFRTSPLGGAEVRMRFPRSPAEARRPPS